MQFRKHQRAVPLVLALTGAMVLAACGSSGSGSSGGGSGSSSQSSLKTGPGVTSTSITIGAFSVLSGPVATAAAPLDAGFEAYLKANASKFQLGGRTVNLQLGDTKYAPATAAQLYQTLAPASAFGFVLGTPIVQALEPQAKADQYSMVVAAQDSTFLNDPNVPFAVPTYSLIAASAVDYIFSKDPNAKIGAILEDDDLGSESTFGLNYALKTHNAKLVATTTVPATSTNLTGAIAAMRAAGATYVFLGTNPTPQVAAVATANSEGYNAKFFAVAFSGQVLQTSAGPALEKQLTAPCPVATFSEKTSGIEAIEAAQKQYEPSSGVNYSFELGWLNAEIAVAILETAYKHNDLTRAGIEAAIQEAPPIDTDGITPVPVKFGAPGLDRMPYRQMRWCSVTTSSPDGEAPLGPYFLGGAAKTIGILPS